MSSFISTYYVVYERARSLSDLEDRDSCLNLKWQRVEGGCKSGGAGVRFQGEDRISITWVCWKEGMSSAVGER